MLTPVLTIHTASEGGFALRRMVPSLTRIMYDRGYTGVNLPSLLLLPGLKSLNRPCAVRLTAVMTENLHIPRLMYGHGYIWLIPTGNRFLGGRDIRLSVEISV